MASTVTVGMSGSWDLSGEIRPTKEASFSTLGLIGTSPNKSADIEYNRCYTVTTDDSDLSDKFGDGDILDALNDMALCVEDGQYALSVTVVVVEEGADDAETITNLAGTSADGTGVFAFKLATMHQAELPRLLVIAGGYDVILGDGDTANQAVQNLASVSSSILGMTFFNGPSTTKTDAITHRELYSSKRLVMTDGGVVVDGVTKPAAHFVAALQAAVDLTHDGIPSHCAGMRALNVGGPGREIDFTLNNPACEGQDLLSYQIGIIVVGDAGADFSVGDGGTYYVGAHTLSDDTLEQFINVVRMQDYVLLNILRTQRQFLVKYNLTVTVARNIIATAQSFLSKLAAKDAIYPNPSVKFVGNDSSPEDWREGKLEISAFAEPHAPLMTIDTTFYRDRDAIEYSIAELEEYSAA